MIGDQNVPDASFKEMIIYQNIRNSGITKVVTRLELFPYSEVIGRILPQTNPTSRIISNIKGEDFTSFTPSYITLAYKLVPA